MKKIFFLFFISALLAGPALVLAQPWQPWEDAAPAPSASACSNIQNFKGVVDCLIGGILTPLISLAMGLALVYFLWGVIKYIRQAGDEKSREEARKVMSFGIIALFVMVSVWGLVRIITETLNLNNQEPRTPSFLSS
jgi:hypothetical protein